MNKAIRILLMSAFLSGLANCSDSKSPVLNSDDGGGGSGGGLGHGLSLSTLPEFQKPLSDMKALGLDIFVEDGEIKIKLSDDSLKTDEPRTSQDGLLLADLERHEKLLVEIKSFLESSPTQLGVLSENSEYPDVLDLSKLRGVFEAIVPSLESKIEILKVRTQNRNRRSEGFDIA